jgi:hypothetical protein
MKIATIGRGNVGGGLGDLWERAGHEVRRLGRDGGDVADADAVLLAVPGRSIADALERVAGLDGKIVIDATNRFGAVPPEGFPSMSQFVKSRTNGPTAKAFNVNFASLYPRLKDAKAAPGNFWCGDAEARDVVEQLNVDAGYYPIYVGPIESAALLEETVRLMFAVSESAGPVVYRMAPVEQLCA